MIGSISMTSLEHDPRDICFHHVLWLSLHHSPTRYRLLPDYFSRLALGRARSSDHTTRNRSCRTRSNHNQTTARLFSSLGLPKARGHITAQTCINHNSGNIRVHDILQTAAMNKHSDKKSCGDQGKVLTGLTLDKWQTRLSRKSLPESHHVRQVLHGLHQSFSAPIMTIAVS